VRITLSVRFLTEAAMERDVDQMIEQGKNVRTQFLRVNPVPVLRMAGMVVVVCAVAISLVVGMVAHQRATEATAKMLSKAANSSKMQ
jgi:hypothetical protein